MLQPAPDVDLPMLLICPRCRRLNAQGQLECHAIVLPDSAQPARLGPSLLPVPVIQCSNQFCAARYPVIEGIPVIFRDPRALDLSLSPPFDLLSLGPERLKALVEGQLPSNSLHSLLARLSRYLRAGFEDWIESSAGDASNSSASTASNIHVVEVMRWIEGLGETTRLTAARHDDETEPAVRISLGCAIGREAFESEQPTVLLDAHLPSLLTGQRLSRDGSVAFVSPQSASQWSVVQVKAPHAPRAPVARICTDVLDPPFLAGAFHSVLGLNLIDSVSDPVTAMGQAGALVAKGGMLTLTSPFAWREEVTPQERWLERQGSPVGTDPETVLLSMMESTFPSSRKLLDRKVFPWSMQNYARETVLYRSTGWCWG